MSRPIWCATFLCALEHGHTVSRACIEANVSRRCAYDRRDTDPEFAAAWSTAQARAEQALRAAFLARVRAEIEARGGASPFRRGPVEPAR